MSSRIGFYFIDCGTVVLLSGVFRRCAVIYRGAMEFRQSANAELLINVQIAQTKDLSQYFGSIDKFIRCLSLTK